MSGRRKSLVDQVRETNFLRKSFGGVGGKNTMTNEEYSALLKQENQDWSNIKRDERKSPKNRPLLIIKKNIHGYLCEDEKLFLDRRPNYKQLLKKAEKYMTTLKILEKLREEIDDYCKTVCDNIDDKIDHYLTSLTTEKGCKKCIDNYCNENMHGLADRKFIYLPDIDLHFLPDY